MEDLFMTKVQWKPVSRILCGLLCVLLFFSSMMPLFAMDTDKTLKVAFYPLDGFFEYDSGGKETGYGVELLEKISEYTGIHFEYVPADTWERTRAMLLSGEADIRLPGTMPSVPSTVLGYTNESVMDTYHAILTLKSRDDLYYKDYENFTSLKIAMTQGLYATTKVREYLDGIHITEDNLKFYNGYALCRQALEDGEVDAIISNIMDMNDELKVLARFYSASNYISMTIGDPYLKTLDTALNEIKMDSPSLLPQLYQKYYPERTVTPYTREEAEYVKNAGVLRVGQLGGAEPLSYLDAETREPAGMFVDLCDLIAEKSGLEFQYEVVPAGVRGVDWLRETGGELVSGVMYSDLSNPSSELAHTDTAFQTSIVVVGREGENFAPNHTMTVALPVGFIGGQASIVSMYPNALVQVYNSNEECLDAILAGEADILLQNLYVVRNALQSPRFDSLEIFPVYQVEECMKLVTLGGEDPVLVAVLNKAISAITDEELNDIIVAHTIAKPYHITWRDTFYKFRLPIRIIGLLFCIVLGLCTFILVIRHRNVKRIQAKNIQLGEAYEQARVASQAKSDFLARMSHDIRTPMNAIIGLTTLTMDHAEEPETVKENLDKVALSSRLLLSIINDVLDMSAIENGKLKIAHAPFDFKQLVSSITAIHYAQCQAKHIDFHVRLVNSVDEWLVGDQLRLNQVLMNLLSNAIKFTSSGWVRLTIEQRVLKQGRLFLHFTVSDTGCGMDDEMLSRLWQPFEQESAHTAQEYGGSGLGLSIVKNLVTMMGGAVAVQSKKGEGTVFSVDLPFDRTTRSELGNPVELKKFRVLVVDDDAERVSYVSTVLERIGVPYASASSCDKALKIMDEARGGRDPYNVCVTDWKTSGLDGLEVARRVRAEYGRDSVVIIVAAYDHSEVEELARAAGADCFVSKPLFQSTLFDMLMSLSHGGIANQDDRQTEFDFTGRRVLLAEDNDMNLLVGVGLLKKANIICETAVNGKIALDMFLASEPGHYDAILMDIQMPVMDGYRATEAIRRSSHPEAQTIPILAMTANAFTEDIAMVLQSGMDDHVVKPIDLDILLTALNRAFHTTKRLSV